MDVREQDSHEQPGSETAATPAGEWYWFFSEKEQAWVSGHEDPGLPVVSKQRIVWSCYILQEHPTKLQGVSLFIMFTLRNTFRS